MNELYVQEFCPKAFSPFGELGGPLADSGHGVGDVALDRPGLSDIRAFCIPPERFIKLSRGTWHAGSYRSEQRDFYNLELIDSNTADYKVCRLAEAAVFAASR
ncbi:MAG: hypothetical protein WB611_17495 [Stellaceae bacterium]